MVRDCFCVGVLCDCDDDDDDNDDGMVDVDDWGRIVAVAAPESCLLFSCVCVLLVDLLLALAILLF